MTIFHAGLSVNAVQTVAAMVGYKNKLYLMGQIIQ